MKRKLTDITVSWFDPPVGKLGKIGEPALKDGRVGYCRDNLLGKENWSDERLIDFTFHGLPQQNKEIDIRVTRSYVQD